MLFVIKDCLYSLVMFAVQMSVLKDTTTTMQSH